MFGTAQLDDGTVAEAIGGQEKARDRVAEAMMHQVRLMVMARLSPTPQQYGAVEEITQTVIVALVDSLPRIENRTLAGLKAYTSTIAARRVADFLRDPAGLGRQRPAPASLDSTFAQASHAGPLYQFLSASGTSPSGFAAREDQLEKTMTELGRLKPEHREVITLAFFDQLSTAQIAECMGSTRPAASMLLVRAVKALRRNLTGDSQLGGAETR